MTENFDVYGWLTGLTGICDDIAAGEAEGRVLRKLYALLRSAPPEVRAELDIASDDHVIERLIDTDARGEAALRLLGGARYMISGGQAGPVKATIVSGSVIHESIAEGKTEAQAICSALAGGLMDWSRRTGLLSPSGARAH